MEVSVHTHVLYVGKDANSRKAKERIERLAKKKKNFNYSVVDVENPGSAEVSLPYLLADEGEFTSMKDIEWFVNQQLEGYLSQKAHTYKLRVPQIRSETRRSLLKINLFISVVLFLSGIGLVFWGLLNNSLFAFAGAAWIGFGFLHMNWIWRKLAGLG